ncbi:hypothetical protein [Chryseobacterium sp. A321]
MKLAQLLILLLPFFLFAQNNSIVIAGKTNVNTFKCTHTNLPLLPALQSDKLPNIQLKVADFDCRNKLMTNDFRKTLSHTMYPTLSIRFVKLKKLGTSNYYKATLEVQLMRSQKTYDITLFQEGNQLVGTKRIQFSDFHISPPTRLGGSIKVQDELDLSVSLKTLN